MTERKEKLVFITAGQATGDYDPIHFLKIGTYAAVDKIQRNHVKVTGVKENGNTLSQCLYHHQFMPVNWEL